jgi:hypothetical protein
MVEMALQAGKFIIDIVLKRLGDVDMMTCELDLHRLSLLDDRTQRWRLRQPWGISSQRKPLVKIAVSENAG